MFCTECGQQNTAEAKFCFRCGGELKGSTQESNADITSPNLLDEDSKKRGVNLSSKHKFLAVLLTIFLAILGAAIISNSLASDQSSVDSNIASETLEPDGELTPQAPVYIEEEVVDNSSDGVIDPGSFVWQRNLDMTGVGVWDERYPNEWVEDVGQQYLFANEVGCLFYVFDENSSDKDLMRRAYQWLSQYAGVHIAGSVWILLDSSYGEKCTGPVTDQFGGYRVN